MKKYFYFAAAALALASCADDQYVGQSAGSAGNGEISFASLTPNATRADEFIGKSAAEKLNNNFIVYGFKFTEASTDAGEALGSDDQVVFDLYNVNYTDGTANTTESNTHGWEYVGYVPHTGSSATEQSIKYWDHSATGYVFSAVSGTGITAEKIKTVTADGATIYDKGWNVTIPQGGSLSDLYASNRVPVGSGDYRKEVKLTFYNLGAKIRFALYETVPGYSIQIDRFYYNGNSSETNFGVDGKFTTLKKEGDSKLTVTYYDSPDAIKNRPKVSFADGDVSKANYGEFGTNIQPTQQIGTHSNEATYDQAEGAYTDILPMKSEGLDLKVDYTLTSTDGSHETIKVTGATAKVPANFTDWKENFAYTYLFKISDNTNGYTGTVSQPAGLYPITFDAVVVNNEEGIQETITSVSNPSITTYQKGVVVTKYDEYVAGTDMDIYFEDGNANVADYKVYEVNNYGTEKTTEEVVANWKNNFCVLTEVEVTTAPGAGDEGAEAADFIPLSDGTYIQKAKGKAAKFTPAAGKTYVIASGDINSATTTYKVVKVSGSETAETYTLSATADQAIEAADGKATFSIKSDSPADAVVYGAKALFRIYSGETDLTQYFKVEETATAGSYEISLTDEGIANGKYPNGDLTVKLVDAKGQVVAIADKNLTVGQNSLTNATTEIVAGKSANVTFKFNDTAWGDADKHAVVVNNNKGISVVAGADGMFTISVAPDVAHGTYTMTIGGVTETVTVDSYSLNSADLYLAADGKLASVNGLTLKKNGTNQTDITLTYSPALTEITETRTTAPYTYASTEDASADAGVHTVSYENAKGTLTIHKYTMTPSAAGNVKKSTGAVDIIVKDNGAEVSATTAKVTCTAQPTDSKYSLVATGKYLRFSNATVAGDYTFKYTVANVDVATITITVVE